MSGDSAIGAAASGLLGTLVALAFVLALAFGALRLLRQWQNRAPGIGADVGLRFVRALPVGPRERVVIVEIEGERVLIGVTAGSITLLKTLGPASPAAEDLA